MELLEGGRARRRFELLLERGEIGYLPVLGELSVRYAVDLKGLKVDAMTCWLDLAEVVHVGACHTVEYGNAVTFGDNLLDGPGEVREARFEAQEVGSKDLDAGCLAF